MLGGREVTLAQQYAAIAVGSIPLFVIAGAGEPTQISLPKQTARVFIKSYDLFIL